MKNYSTYTASDFLLDDVFVTWVKNPTPELDQFWQQWLDEHPERMTIVEEARFWIQSVTVSEKLPADRDVNEAIQLVQAKLRDGEPVLIPLHQRINPWTWRVAATLLLVLGVGLYVWQRQSMQFAAYESQLVSGEIGEMMAQENLTHRSMTIRLPDGSRVTLSPQSKVAYPKQFAVHTREVNLTGEAFFDVVHRPQQPFIVRTGKLNVRVLGTSFLVKAYQNAPEINVQVKSGKVAVSKALGDETPPTIDGVLITPNQQVTYSLQDNVFRKSLVEAPVLVDKQKREEDFVYDEVPVTTVFRQLETAYGIDVVYDPEKLARCTLTARLTNEPMYQKLNMICQAIGATHETVGTQIFIHSEGCEE